MDGKIRFILLTVFTVMALLMAGTASAHPGSPHIHEGPALLQDHSAHSPFHQHSQHIQAKNEGQSLHCILNGHSSEQPCPHMQSSKFDNDGVEKLSAECGGHSGPIGASVVKTDATYYAIASTPDETYCSDQELFPVIHPLLSRSTPKIAPPPKRALLSY